MNIVALLLIILVVYTYRTSLEGGDGLQNLYSLPLTVLAIIMLVVDYFLQRSSFSYQKIAIAELVFLALLFLLFKFAFRTEKVPIFILPENFNSNYVAVFYDIEGAPKLFSSDGNQNILTDGIILASNKSDEVRSAVAIEGNLPSGDQPNGFSSFFGSIQCEGKIYQYQIWYLEEYDYEKIDDLQEGINEELSRRCDLFESNN